MGLIIAFVGKAGSGKSTACEYLSTDNTIRINFKDKLIEELPIKFPHHIAQIIKYIEKNEWEGKSWTYERLVKEKPDIFRSLMQNYATEVCRAIDPDYFIYPWQEKVDEYYNHRILTDDCRYLNEAAAIKKNGGLIIKIIRTGHSIVEDHSSETEQDQIEADYTIEARDVEELHRKLDDITRNFRT